MKTAWRTIFARKIFQSGRQRTLKAKEEREPTFHNKEGRRAPRSTVLLQPFAKLQTRMLRVSYVLGIDKDGTLTILFIDETKSSHGIFFTLGSYVHSIRGSFFFVFAKFSNAIPPKNLCCFVF